VESRGAWTVLPIAVSPNGRVGRESARILDAAEGLEPVDLSTVAEESCSECPRPGGYAGVHRTWTVAVISLENVSTFRSVLMETAWN
jgi:hypothetical protein